jgi:hypothetical protein
MNFNKSSEAFAKELSGLPIKEQLESRRVISFRICYGGGCYCLPLEEGFRIQVSTKKWKESQSLFYIFGWALGVTYCYAEGEDRKKELNYDDHEWCYDFAAEWSARLSDKNRKWLQECFNQFYLLGRLPYSGRKYLNFVDNEKQVALDPGIYFLEFHPGDDPASACISRLAKIEIGHRILTTVLFICRESFLKTLSLQRIIDI